MRVGQSYPNSQRRFAGILIASLKEPPEDMLVLADIRIARVTLDIRIKLADAFRNLLVAHIDTSVSFLRGEVSRLSDELGGNEARCQQGHGSVELQHDGLL